MADFQIHVDPPLETTTKNLATYSELVSDLRPFWDQLGRALADESQRRWPLKRRTGALRASLTWAGNRLGARGTFESTRDRLVYGSWCQSCARMLP